MQRKKLRSLATTLFALAMFAETDNAFAQVVQLPTFRFFGLSTTVSVPDRGSAYLGGVSRSAMNRSEHGLPILGRVPVAGRAFGNRAIAGRTELSGASVSAQIHDFEAMDQELLGQAGAVARRSQPSKQRGAANATVARTTQPPSRPLPHALKSDEAGRVSVAELRRQQALQRHTAHAASNESVHRDLERARELVALGNVGLAKVYVQRAAKVAAPELPAEISAIYRSLSDPTRPNSLA
jgi:hypothetical protein